MGGFIKNLSTAAPSGQHLDTVGPVAGMAGPLTLATVVAAWPAGVSQLAQHVDACQRCEPGQVGLEWLARAAG